jgi:NAD(P)-dependent dehydrogenase (short-subunit alcohol dehydrogenase family)
LDEAGRLLNRAAIVVGADTIGCGIARALAQAGASVALLDADPDAAAVGAQRLRTAGHHSLAAHFSASGESALGSVLSDTASRFNSLEILVVNLLPKAYPTPLVNLSADALARSAAAIRNSVAAMQAALPLLRSAGCGRIINVGHRYGEGINGEMGAYNAAAWALWGLTRTAAVEWGQYQITSNLLMPFADTAELRAAQQHRPELMELLLGQVPLRRAGDPVQDIGGAAVFLAADEAAFVNGEILYADGGQHIAGPVLNPAKFPAVS